MGNEQYQAFDLPALLKLDNLGIRKTAKAQPSLQIGEFFNLLEKFIVYTEGFDTTLQKISDQKAHDKDFQDMADLKTMLLALDIGHDSLIPVIDEITSLGKRGHIIHAADRAQKFQDDFLYLHKQIKAAKKTDPVDETLYLKGTQLLSKVINLMDHEEMNRKMRVLAVDDAPSVISTISEVLDNEYQVFGLTNPTMLENFLKQITPELILLDYEMPELNGFDLVPIIRGFEEHKDTPIIFLTSMGTLDHVSAAYALGACDFIVKPFQDTILREKVAKHIVKKKSF